MILKETHLLSAAIKRLWKYFCSYNATLNPTIIDVKWTPLLGSVFPEAVLYPLNHVALLRLAFGSFQDTLQERRLPRGQRYLTERRSRVPTSKHQGDRNEHREMSGNTSELYILAVYDTEFQCISYFNKHEWFVHFQKNTPTLGHWTSGGLAVWCQDEILLDSEDGCVLTSMWMHEPLTGELSKHTRSGYCSTSNAFAFQMTIAILPCCEGKCPERLKPTWDCKIAVLPTGATPIVVLLEQQQPPQPQPQPQPPPLKTQSVQFL